MNEVAELKDCNNSIFFEARKHKDLYMWVSRCPSGPSVKFLVNNVHTMSEIKLTGNCLKGSRPVMHFDAAFNDSEDTKVLKELLSQAFASPKGHPKVKPFVDHVFSFFFLNGRVYFRNYQIAYEANRGTEKEGEPILVEIGPRFVLTPIKIFAGSFSGALLWENPKFVSPNAVRTAMKRKASETFEVLSNPPVLTSLSHLPIINPLVSTFCYSFYIYCFVYFCLFLVYLNNIC